MAGRYHVILADPPWQYRAWSGKSKNKRTADSHYRTLRIEQLTQMREMVDGLVKEPCALFLWVTPPTMFEYGEPLLRAWGFEYETVAFGWLKTNPKKGGVATGMGHYTRGNVELCLLGTRGRVRRKSAAVSQVIVSPRRRHSEKPVAQYERIQSLLPGPYLEMFARYRHPGWDAWGDQVTSKNAESTFLAHRRSSIRPIL